MERTWIRGSSFNTENGNVDVGGGGGGICVPVRSLWKIGEVKREGVESGYRRVWLHEPGWLALQRSRHLQKSTLQLYDSRASSVSWDPSIVMPGSRVEIFQVLNHTCRAARRMNSARNRTAGNTLLCSCALLPISIKMAGPGWPFSWN